MKNFRKRVTLPRYGEYNCAFKYLLEKGLDCTYIMPPPLTKHTLDIGTKYSPEFVCTPFKTTLGSFIEAIENGAETLIMTHGDCRLGYYAELHEQILRDMNYEFEFINLAKYDTGRIKDIFNAIRKINPKVRYSRLIITLNEAIRMVEYVDEITSEYYQNCGFDPTGSEWKQIYKRFLSSMYTASSKNDIENAYQTAKTQFSTAPLDKPSNPLRVGIIGEFYTAVDAFSNLETEQKLAEMGVEIHRWMNVTNHLLHSPGEKNQLIRIKDLATYHMGPTSSSNLSVARDYAERGFDGLIHIKSAGCTPEIDLMPVLQNISSDYKLPILYLTFDSQTSDVGLLTRLEAFYDMIRMRKKVV